MHDAEVRDREPAGNVFYALVPPPVVIAPLRAAVDLLRRENDGLAWIAPERWHVTVRFLGRADPRPHLERSIVLPERPRLTVAGAGTFGSRVLWAGVRGPVADMVAAVGGDPQGHTAHLTLARVRGRQRWSGLREVAARLRYAEQSWLPDRLVLLRSVPGRSYEELAAWTWIGAEP